MYISYILKKHIRSPQFYNKNYILDKCISSVYICTRKSNIFYLHSHLKIMVQDNTLVKRMFSYSYWFGIEILKKEVRISQFAFWHVHALFLYTDFFTTLIHVFFGYLFTKCTKLS